MEGIGDEKVGGGWGSVANPQLLISYYLQNFIGFLLWNIKFYNTRSKAQVDDTKPYFSQW